MSTKYYGHHAKEGNNRVLIVILILIFVQVGCKQSATEVSTPSVLLYFEGCAVDSNNRSQSNRVVILYIDGVEEKRDITMDGEDCEDSNSNFSLGFQDGWGIFDKYEHEFQSQHKDSRLYLGTMREEETRYFFIEDPTDPELIHEVIIWVLAGDSSSVSPERMELGSGEYQARQILIDQVKFWTKEDSVTYDYIDHGPYSFSFPRSSTTHFYLTYLSPQLIEAAIDYQGKKQNMPEEELDALVDEVKVRLRQESSIGFLLRIIDEKANSDFSIQFGNQFGSTVQLENTFGDQFAPSEYDQLFDYPLSTSEINQGYVFFPKEADGRISVDLDTAPSIFVRASELEIINYYDQIDSTESAMWRFDLLPISIPLEEITNRPQQDSTLNMNDIIEIISNVLDFVSLISKFIP